jgi:hypothetical protein
MYPTWLAGKLPETSADSRHLPVRNVMRRRP